MDKLGYARGLVKYSTENAVKEHWTKGQIVRHVLRPRILIYTGILFAILVAMGTSLALRDSFKVDAIRDRGSLGRLVSGGKIENVFRLQIMNATEQNQRYDVSAEGLPGIRVQMDLADVTVESAQSRWVSVAVQIPYDAVPAGSHPFRFLIARKDSSEKVTEKSVFIVPN
jgi:polyferredoxin